ncbi:MAG: hypothetical protein ACLQBY_16225 [Solirubrobacteraceae bacterium]
MIAVLGLVAAAVAASPAAAAETKAVTAPPFQGTQPLPLVLSVDTVNSGAAANKSLEDAKGNCSETNIIHVGQTIVFRMWGVDVKTGGEALTEANVENEKGAYVIIPGMLVNGASSTVRVPLVWGEHTLAKTPEGEKTKHAYWTAGVTTKGETAAAATPWQIESPTGGLTPIAEKTKVEIPPNGITPLAFRIRVVTKPRIVTKLVSKKVTKHGKKIIKKVKKQVTEPGQKGEFTQAAWPISSQLMILP